MARYINYCGLLRFRNSLVAIHLFASKACSPHLSSNWHHIGIIYNSLFYIGSVAIDSFMCIGCCGLVCSIVSEKTMNDLKKDIGQTLRMLQTGRMTPLAARDQIIARFKAHIEGVERPEMPVGRTRAWLFGNGVDAQREKYEESLKGGE